MSNLVNIDYVISVANQQGCAIWKITDMQGETLDKRNSATADLQKSLADLRDAWQQIQGDFINIKIAAKAMARGGDQQSTTFYYKVKCFAAAESSTAAADILPAVTGKMDPGIYSLLSDLKVQIAEQKKDVEIRELKRKLEDKGKGDKQDPQGGESQEKQDGEGKQPGEGQGQDEQVIDRAYLTSEVNRNAADLLPVEVTQKTLAAKAGFTLGF